VSKSTVAPTSERKGGPAAFIEVDVRVIAATHQDLHSRVAEGRFRRDLCDRLAGYEMAMPALRYRPRGNGPSVARVAGVRRRCWRPLSPLASAATRLGPIASSLPVHRRHHYVPRARAPPRLPLNNGAMGSDSTALACSTT